MQLHSELDNSKPVDTCVRVTSGPRCDMICFQFGSYSPSSCVGPQCGILVLGGQAEDESRNAFYACLRDSPLTSRRPSCDESENESLNVECESRAILAQASL